ncbi:MAG: hypothetical protein M1837_000492 [Sclerophora amabilis]|nr:MAG: hypothetical protein M1837_000492 [Sclerophora amabilis]
MDDLNEQTVPLLQYVAEAVGKTHDFGNLTSSIYDTAWVSVVRKRNDPASGLLFPESFQYVLERQLPSGGWESYDSEIDGIMNTLGGLFALKKNAHLPHPGMSPEDMVSRIDRAAEFLRQKLEGWDVASCDHVGFEIIIPSMLECLEQEGLFFEFPGQNLLMELNKKKLAKIHPSIWSGKTQTTITHSLEAFAGKADFTGLRNQLVFGGMGSSPSSTAAYLMQLPTWDEEVENYLRTVLSSRKSDDYGGVPGMYPTTGFEVLWIVSTLLENGFDASTLTGVESVLDLTEEVYESLDGLVSGFSKLSVPDADDTAKSIIIRNLLGKKTTPDKLIERFEGTDHFLTYRMERHPSLTTNCNVLSAMLESPEPMKYISQIEKCARFLCFSWTRSDALFMDKWNISEYYPIMLMSEALIRLVKVWDQGIINSLPDELILSKIPLVLFQALMQTLQKQNADGSWGPKPSREIAAYAIIALANLASLPFVSGFSAEIKTAIERGRSFIASNNQMPDVEYVWIAKTNYSPINISKAYVLAGRKMSYPKYSLSSSTKDQLDIPEKGLSRYSQIFSQLPHLNSFPLWRIRGSIMEGYLFLKQLKRIRLDIFGRTDMKKDEYFDFIAMTFSCANNLRNSFLRTDVLFDMMSLVLRVYQVDEYVEHVIGKRFAHATDDIKRIIEKISLEVYEKSPTGHTNGYTNGLTNGHTNGCSNGVKSNGSSTPNGHEGLLLDEAVPRDDFTDVYDKLKAFMMSIIHHPSVKGADKFDQELLKYELRECLLSHIVQIEDSQQYYAHADRAVNWIIPRGSYHGWARSTAASHSCAPLSLAFMRCLLKNGSGHKKSAEEQYLVQDLWMHLSNKCRMENDRASLSRDRKELNLNSLDFPEFHLEGDKGIQDSKEQISRIVTYEKRCCEMAFEALRQVTCKVDSTDLDALLFYYFLSDIYSDIYTMRDISCEFQAVGKRKEPSL